MAIATQPLIVTPAHPLFAAEVSGVDLTRPLDDATFERIAQAFDEYSVLVFHGQALTDEQQMAFSERFGPLETTVRTLGKEDRLGAHMVDLSNMDEDGKLMDWSDRRMLYQSGNQLWHTDSSFKPVPAHSSALSARVVPSEGGETEFVSMRVAYDALPEDLRRQVDGRIVVHSFGFSRSLIDPGIGTEVGRDYPPVRHALVRANPRNGRKNIYIGSHAWRIEGLGIDESRILHRQAPRVHDPTRPHLQPLLARGRPGDVGQPLRAASRASLGQRPREARDASHDRRRQRTYRRAAVSPRAGGAIARDRRAPCAEPPTTSASLRDGRAIFLDGERVDDVTKHPAFAESVRRIAERYDAAAESPDITTCLDPESGRRIGAMWLIPRSAEDLGRRRAVHRFWAEGSYGLMGRTPDHVASVLTGFAGWRQLFDRGGRQFGDNVVRFYERARDEDLYVAYAIVPPQIDRSTPAHKHPEPFLHPGVVKETDAGIVIRGAHSIATSVTMADWLYVSYITPLAPGDVDYAISLVVPVGAEGLRLLPRRPYATIATSVYDYPLSARFDEVDTTVVFDDVFVPWDQVFVYKNVELVTAQFHESPAHVQGELPVAGALRRQARAPRGARHEARRGRARRGRRHYAGHARRRHRHALRDLRRAREGGRALSARQRGLRAAASAVRLRGDEPPAPAHRGPVQDGARARGGRLPAPAVIRGELPLPRDPRLHRALLPVDGGRRARPGEAASS